MGKCVFSFDKIHIDNQKSDNDHADNDWLSMVWLVNDKIYSKTVPLLKSDGDRVLHTGDVLNPFHDYVVCENTDTVIVTYSISNLGGYDDWEKQAEVAANFTKKIAATVAPIYLEAAAAVLAGVATGG